MTAPLCTSTFIVGVIAIRAGGHTCYCVPWPIHQRNRVYYLDVVWADWQLPSPWLLITTRNLCKLRWNCCLKMANGCLKMANRRCKWVGFAGNGNTVYHTLCISRDQFWCATGVWWAPSAICRITMWASSASKSQLGEGQPVQCSAVPSLTLCDG